MYLTLDTECKFESHGYIETNSPSIIVMACSLISSDEIRSKVQNSNLLSVQTPNEKSVKPQLNFNNFKT